MDEVVGNVTGLLKDKRMFENTLIVQSVRK